MIETMLRSAATHLRAGDFAAALEQARQALQADPDALPALGMGALAALRLGRTDEAEGLLRRQLALAPGDRAVRANLAGLLSESGRNEEALALAQDHEGHHGLAWLAGWLHQQSGDLEAAQAAYEVAIAANPQDFRAWNNLGNVRSARGDWRGATAALERAVTLGADSPHVYVSLCQALSGPQNRAGRIRAAEDGLKRFPDSRELALEHALALAADWHSEEAIAALRQIAVGEDAFGRAHFELGMLYENLARLDDLDTLIAAAEARGWRAPELDFLRAWSLYRRDCNADAAEMLASVPVAINPLRVEHLRGLVADKLDQADIAFAAFTSMNQAALEQNPDPFPAAISYRQWIDTGAVRLAEHAALPDVLPAPHAPRDPAFVVGFPRSGTTLLDTLLGGLSELQVFEEEPMLAQVQADYPDLAYTRDAGFVAHARAQYFEMAENLQGPVGERRILDKLPLHMARVAEIHRLFPQADFVLVERHPCDAVLSCFIANFTLNGAMRSFTDLEEAARTYDAVFSYWERAIELLPLRVHRVRYERMVANLEGEMRPLVDFLGLDWRDEVLDNEALAEARGVVRTASYAQIGKPIYSHARERWRRYRKHMEPVLPILASWVEKLGYEL